MPSRNYALGGNIEQVFNELMFCSLMVTVQSLLIRGLCRTLQIIQGGKLSEFLQINH